MPGNKDTGKILGKMSVFIVDDSQGAREALADDLARFDIIGKVSLFSSYSSAMLPLIGEDPDILFLDVEVPGCTGLEFLETLRKKKINLGCRVVFYTAYSHYMIDAIRQQAFDYLLKPYLPQELEEIINRIATCDCTSRDIPASSSTTDRGIAIHTLTGMKVFRPEEMLYFKNDKASRKWVAILTNLSRQELMSTTKANDILTLSDQFAQANPSLVINTRYLSAIEAISGKLTLCPPFDSIDGLKASRQCLKKLRDAFDII